MRAHSQLWAPDSRLLLLCSEGSFFYLVDYIVVTENMPQEASVVLGRDTRFMCGVTTLNALEVTFQWSKYFAPLKSNRHVRISRTDDKNKVSQISVQRGYLDINKAKYSDEGLYSCEAIGNNKMLVRKDVYLKVQGKSPCLCRYRWTGTRLRSKHQQGAEKMLPSSPSILCLVPT